MSVATDMRTKLEAAFEPEWLEILDKSEEHRGHIGATAAGETHFHILICTRRFSGLSQIERQRWVYRTLAAELAGPVHALSLTTVTPKEKKV